MQVEENKVARNIMRTKSLDKTSRLLGITYMILN